jgi:amino acid adenylation domain-containing protein/FkbM family methyltransferase
MVFHSLRQPALYHSQMLLPLADDDFDLARFRRAVALLLERHAILRSGLFLSGFEEPIQIVYQRAVMEIGLEDLSALEHGQQEEHLRRHLAQDIAQPLDPRRPPLWRLRLFRLDPQSLCLAWSMHHAITDGWSTACLFAELCQTYQRLGREPAYRPAPLGCSYKDFIVDELVEKQNQASLDFWRQELAGHQRLELPWKAQAGQPSQALIFGHPLGVELKDELLALARRLGLSLKGLCLTAYVYMLHMISRQGEVLTGLVTNCRPLRPDGDKVIGCFLNSVPLRLALPPGGTWLELARLVEAKLTALKKHERLSLMQIARAAGERGDQGNPFFDVLFNFVNFEAPQAAVSGQPSARVEIEGHTATNTLLDFTVNTSQGRFELEIIYRPAMFAIADLERLCGYFQACLLKLARQGREVMTKAAIMGPRETELLLRDFNATDRPFPRDRTIHQLIAQQAARTPQARAVVFRGQTLSYAQLERRAENLARRLVRQGLEPGGIVALRLHRGLEMMTAILGILKAGGAYLPVDPGHPEERLRYLLQDSRAGLLLTTRDLAGGQAHQGLAQEICLDALDLDGPDPGLSATPLLEARPNDLAYVIYTSGSTGQPKGVMVEHQALVNRLHWMQSRYPLAADDLILQKTPYTFDVSVWELLWWGLAGAGVCFLEPGGEKDPARIIATIEAQGVTVMHFVPSMLGAFLDYLAVDPGRRVPRLASLRQVFASGEALAPEQANRFNRLLHDAHGTRLANLYGPTEAAIDVTWFDCQGAEPLDKVPIGRPIDNIRLYVLDQDQALQPLGVAGELCISGVGLARGYLGQPELTARVFRTNPLAPAGAAGQASLDHGRLYHTGDLARWLPDGNLEYLGRLDHQVKIRGFRIEPGEIERRLNACAPVKDSLVLALGQGAAKRLAAYVLVDPRQAPTLARLLELAPQYPDSPWRELPDHTPFFSLNQGETAFMYQEIVAENVYLGQGVSLPPGAVVLDVGANIGLFSWWVRRLCPDARVLALEPIPRLCQLLELNNRLHGLEARVLNLGLWSRPGQLEFTFYPHASILSGALADAAQEAATVAAYLRASGQVGGDGPVDGQLLDELLGQRLESQRLSCPVSTLSAVLASEGLERVDLLKIDVEKGELEVLAGLAEGDWPKIRQLVVEVHDHDGRLEGLRGMLEARGYQVSVSSAGAQVGTGLHTLVALAAGQEAESPDAKASPPPAPEPWPTPARLAEHLRQALGQSLPEYMVPSYFVPLLAWPLGSSGKTDRKALPKPQADIGQKAGRQPGPQDHLERRLAAIFVQVLAGEKPGPAPAPGLDDNFLELGGDSLRSIAVITRIAQELGVEISIPEFLDNLTVAQLAELIRRRQGQGRDNSEPRPGLPEASVEVKIGGAAQVQDSPLVLLRQGPGASLFCFPDLLGQAAQYITLAGLLTGYTVYAFDYPEEAGDLERYAALVAEASGPAAPVLLGYSAGGALALAVARRLEERGRPLAGLVLLDSFRVSPRLGQDPRLAQRLKRRFMADLADLASEEESGRLAPEMLARARRFLDLYLALPDPGPLEAQIHLLAAQGRRESKLLGGWREATRGAYHAHPGHGRHMRMLSPPEVEGNCLLLARILACLSAGGPDRVEGR